jgi:DNA invertase Pin-like site-specific DNA recombinase
MPRQKRHPNRVYKVVGEPGPGAAAVGYVRYSMVLQDPASIETQKRRIREFARKKGWKIVRWYVEPEESAKYEEIEARPVFAELLNDAGKEYQVVLCYMNNRWSRNLLLELKTLSYLRNLGVWWATSDGLWDIDRIQQDGFDIAFIIDAQMNATFVRQLSERTIDGKEDRALDGYHNGNVRFGYLPPDYPKSHDGAPSTWRPERTPVRPDPVNFPALVRLGELVAQGWTDAAIADELVGYFTNSARFGRRPLTKDTVAAIRQSSFPREFALGCGHGTICTPSGKFVEGRHQAAWSWDLWHRMDEVKTGQYRRPRVEAQRRPHELSRIIVCAACHEPLRVACSQDVLYYRDTSTERKLDCAAEGSLWIKSTTVLAQLIDILENIELPAAWREAIADRCTAEMIDLEAVEKIRHRRAKLEEERNRLGIAYIKGYITEQDLDAQGERIRAELLALPLPNDSEIAQAAISADETLGNLASYWTEATEEERRDIIGALFEIEGLVYDLERKIIAGLLPRESILPVLALGLEKTAQWEQRDSGLWLRAEYLPPKLERSNLRKPPLQSPSLAPEQKEEALKLVEQGMSLRQVAKQFGTSYESIRRVMKKRKASGDNG